MQKIKKAIITFLFLLFLYALLRLLFYLLYFTGHNLPYAGPGSIIYWGLRMDITAVFYTNVPFLFFYLFAGSILPQKVYHFLAGLLFFVFNIPALAVNIIDLAYYKFNNRRSTTDILYVFKDSMAALPSFLKQYWTLVLLFILFCILCIYMFRYCINQDSRQPVNRPSPKNILASFILLTFLWGLARGAGTNPITPSTALLYVNSTYQPLVNNSTITFIYSALKKQTTLVEPAYFSQNRLDTLFSIRRQYAQEQNFKRRNVVIFILESFSAELLEKGSAAKAKTPFLDSLRAHSIDCRNGFANGAESNKGIVALLGSMPPLTDEPFFYSGYSSDKLRGIGNILSDEGYSTHFFMGTPPDHFGFGKWCHMIGINDNYSAKEYNNPAHNDGNWGIYDHYFLPYAAEVLKSKKSPFLAVLYNLSSHPPFAIPPALKKQFAVPGQTAQQNSISYVDYSLKLFFDVIKKETWYDSTLFVFSSDHTHPMKHEGKSLLYNFFRIPVFFHTPANKTGTVILKPVQQMDIIPTILDMLCYSRPFMSFGNSILRQDGGYAVNKVFDVFQLIDSSYLTGFSQKPDSLLYFYNYKKDPLLNHNLLNDKEASPELIKRRQKLQAILQRFEGSLKNNQLFIK